MGRHRNGRVRENASEAAHSGCEGRAASGTGGFEVPFPIALLEWLCAGTESARLAGRKPPTLTLWQQGMRWHACLHHRPRELVAFYQADSLDELLLQLGSRLETGDVRWKPNRRSS